MIKEIANSIYYVGVNDRKTELFERLWPLPLGVSYNSYLIRDKSNVLIDTVEHTYGELFFRQITEVIGNRPIDYLVINHIEPDHSSSISELRYRYPNVKIIGNAKTLSMLAGFYGITDNLLEIRDCDTLCIGENTLSFFTTPMVHWPETMMTYLPSSGTLFSGDAFGSFGALNGGVLDQDINTSVFDDEMFRYYANIVGKYGSPVEKAIGKLSQYPISMICSTHGPVWKRDVASIVDRYLNLSRYKADKGVVIAYGSMYGHTENVAECIASSLSKSGIKNIAVHDVSKSDISYILRDIFKYNGLIIGSPTYSGELFPKVEALLSQIELRGVKGRVFGCFGSYSWAGAALKRLISFAERMNWDVACTPVEIKQAGSEPDITDACCKLASAVAEQISCNVPDATNRQR